MATAPRPMRSPAARPVYCDECGTPVARVTRRGLVIEIRHHGERHTTTIPLAELQALVQAASAPPPDGV